MRDAYDIGRRVFEAGARGRAKVLEWRRRRLAEITKLVKHEAERDRAMGLPEHGRAARVARRLRQIPTRTVYRVYANVAEWQTADCKLVRAAPKTE